jgi:7-cyano-7-deazaguanine reductase
LPQQRWASALPARRPAGNGYWYPRGGIPIDVFWQTGRLPKGIWIPDQGVAPYRGRG